MKLKEKNIKELRMMIGDLENSIQSNYMEISMNKSSKTHLVNVLKRNLARVLTIIREKEIRE